MYYLSLVELVSLLSLFVDVVCGLSLLEEVVGGVPSLHVEWD